MSLILISKPDEQSQPAAIILRDPALAIEAQVAAWQSQRSDIYIGVELEAPEVEIALPENATVHMWIGDADYGGSFNFFFTVFQGKRPAWHKVVLPAIQKAVRRLAGGPAWSFDRMRGRHTGSISGNEHVSLEKARLYLWKDLQCVSEKRRSWLLWQDGVFVDLFTKEQLTTRPASYTARALDLSNDADHKALLAFLGCDDLAATPGVTRYGIFEDGRLLLLLAAESTAEEAKHVAAKFTRSPIH